MYELQAAGALLNAALFLAGLFVIALMTGNHLGVVLVLLSCGAATLSYVAQMAKAPRMAIVLTALSWTQAMVAAFDILYRYGL